MPLAFTQEDFLVKGWFEICYIVVSDMLLDECC